MCGNSGHRPHFGIVTAYVLELPYQLDRPFSYRLPGELDVSAGDFVAVPFGGGNRPHTALITAVEYSDDLEKAQSLKPICSVFDRAYSLNAEQLALVGFLRDYTLCTTADAIHTITPAAAFSRFEERVVCTSPLPDIYPLTSYERELYELVKSKGSVLKNELLLSSDKKTAKALETLAGEGCLRVELSVKEVSNVRFTTLYSLSPTLTGDTDALASLKLRSEAQRRVLLYLAENGTVEQSKLLSATDANHAQLRSLLGRGYIVSERKETYRIPYSASGAASPVSLSPHQRLAADRLTELTRSGEPKAALLYGITGSGKTQVIRAVMDAVIASGRSVIVLVPEISLTPQTISVFSACYGERTAVLHSALSAGERFDAWRRIKRGEVDVCIGTRSAVFAPFSNLGLIVLDEEQEHTYKSDFSPKYHARDIARFRCAKHNAVMLLASATPSIESYYKAKKGIYTLVELTERYGSATLPTAEIADMRSETRVGNFSLFSQSLINELSSTVADGGQAILLLNRRGYHSFVSCPSCGAVATCPHCSVSLTHHRSRFDPNGYLCCHYCGHRTAVPEKCPSCGFGKMRFMGYGTQMAEEQLAKLLPNAKLLRMDADTTSGKFSYDEILGKFRRHEADILLGTQMVAKGHDFPNVTLVGILSAEQSLYLDDYRANERTFSMLCQTIGRAGRASDKGKALIQTYSPEHNVIQLAQKQDYPTFYEGELKLRSALCFPPFCDIAVFTVTADDERNAFKAATTLFEWLRQTAAEHFSKEYFTMFGPFEAPIYKLNEKYRARLVVKFRNSRPLRTSFREAMTRFGKEFPPSVSVSADINPNSI